MRWWWEKIKLKKIKKGMRGSLPSVSGEKLHKSKEGIGAPHEYTIKRTKTTGKVDKKMVGFREPLGL